MPNQLTISPTNLLAEISAIKLRPYRTIDLPNLIIWEFWRGDPRKRGDIKEMATICYSKKSKTIKLKYSPTNGDVQATEEFTADKILDAAKLLKEMGF